MSFKKSSELTFVKRKLESYSQAEVIASALLYMEYRIKYNSRRVAEQTERCKAALIALFENLLENEYFDETFNSLEEFSFVAAAAAKENGWLSLECVIDSMDLHVGKTGGMPYQLRSTIIGAMKSTFEHHYDMPLTELLRPPTNEPSLLPVLEDSLESEPPHA